MELPEAIERADKLVHKFKDVQRLIQEVEGR